MLVTFMSLGLCSLFQSLFWVTPKAETIYYTIYKKQSLHIQGISLFVHGRKKSPYILVIELSITFNHRFHSARINGLLLLCIASEFRALFGT